MSQLQPSLPTNVGYEFPIDRQRKGLIWGLHGGLSCNLSLKISERQLMMKGMKWIDCGTKQDVTPVSERKESKEWGRKTFRISPHSGKERNEDHISTEKALALKLTHWLRSNIIRREFDQIQQNYSFYLLKVHCQPKFVE